jgi:hypothetical protein
MGCYIKISRKKDRTQQTGDENRKASDTFVQFFQLRRVGFIPKLEVRALIIRTHLEFGGFFLGHFICSVLFSKDPSMMNS